MKFGILTLITALVIAGIAAWFSIAGLIAIFSGAAIAIAVMAGALEVGKVVAASWLYRNWNTAGIALKSYLCVAVAVLMFITSMGIFGFLSKAHIEQTAASGDNTLRIEQLDQRIEREQSRINDAQSVIAQLDNAVTVLQNNDRISGPNGAVAIRRSQQTERTELNTTIDQASDRISELRDQRIELAQEQLAKEVEVGPLKYIAELIYGKDEARNFFDEAVRWIIIILVVVFDPLAIALLIAANKTLARYGIHLEPQDPQHEHKPNSDISVANTDPQPEPNQPAIAESEPLPVSEPHTDDSHGVLLQPSGTTDNQPPEPDQSAGVAVAKKIQAQKKRSANSKSKSVSLKQRQPKKK